jgi:small subunit ribosomal protein S6e
LDLHGYEFEIAGGSDYCGFPMRKDVNGIMRKAILVTKGFGNKYNRKGMRLRRTVAGNTIYNKTSQVNLKILKYGSTPLLTVTAEEKKE